MKLGSLKSLKSLDGELCIISQDLRFYVVASELHPEKPELQSLRVALEKRDSSWPLLQKLSEDLNSKKIAVTKPYQPDLFHSALPRTFLFADGSAFIHHIRLVRKARNAEPPETLMTVPLMYQAESTFIAPTQDIPQIDFSHGTDFEGEVGVITDFVKMGSSAEEALKKIILVVLINDVSLRGLIPAELAGGFGFFQSKPAKSLSPVAVTLDELGDSWNNGRVSLPLSVSLNNEFFGKANAKEMHFHFGELIAHAARTRDLPAGALIGSGTVSNEDPAVGSSCLVERRILEQINTGAMVTPFMRIGDRIKMEMVKNGQSIFGAIDQKVAEAMKS